jgi:hypothetical protein
VGGTPVVTNLVMVETTNNAVSVNNGVGTIYTKTNYASGGDASTNSYAATTTKSSSKRDCALSMMLRCPKVGGSKDPGKTALIMPQI